MTELGTRLKEARMSKGYSLDDLQEITKIQKRYLSAIEEGNYSIMPGSFYVRAFIKQYAEAVDLDSNDLLETYKGEIPANKSADQSAATSPISQPVQRRAMTKKAARKSVDWMPKIIVALFIIVIIVSIWFLKQHNFKSDVVDDPKQDVNVESTDVSHKNKAQSSQKDNVNKEKENTKEEENTSSKKEEKPLISKGKLESDNITTTYTLTGTKDLKVKVKVTGSTWIGIQDESGNEISSQAKNFKADQMYNNGDVLEMDATGKKSIRVRLGASPNGTIYVNNEQIKFAASPTERYTQNIVIKLEEEE
ncbi:helix-turn-helix domain-containing protein [Rummeliibacillus stabekisii]|uniref:helix-turn-helix domain-containing protein n=1 Tax=Rummeliibacillus stabekisii TaxID=241244 RepID=UPI0037130B95